MPTISSFLGIVIRMYYDDHLPPHFHARYGEYEAAYDIRTLKVIAGELPRRANGHVVEWAQLHQSGLMDNWNLAVAHMPLFAIDPLE
jgi:hypothetical protein